MGEKKVKRPPEQHYTIVGLYGKDGDIVVEHVEAKSPRQALEKFFGDEDYGDARRGGCSIVSIFEGLCYDKMMDVTDDNDLVTYADIAEAIFESCKVCRKKKAAESMKPLKNGGYICSDCI